MHLDGLCFSFYCQELTGRLVGSRITKIIQLNPVTIGLVIRSRTDDICLIINANPDRPSLHLGEMPGIRQEQAPAFCMLLRKHLENGRIAAITQLALDRVVTIDIDSLGPDLRIVTKRLTFEWTGRNCNLVFWEDGFVIDAVRYISRTQNRFRQIYPQQPYIFPPVGTSLFPLPHQADGETVVEALQAALDKRSIEKRLLSATTGLGPLTVQQILFRAGLPKTLPDTDLDEADWQSLRDAWNAFFTELRENGPAPSRLVDSRNKTLAVLPFCSDAATLPAGQRLVRHDSLVAALHAYYYEQPTQTPLTDALLEKLEQEKARLTRRLAKITAEKAAAESSELTRQLADSLMAQCRLDLPPSGQVTLINLYDEQPYQLALDPLLSVTANAQLLYKRYHKQKRAVEELTQQILQGEEMLSYLENLLFSLETVVNRSELEEIRQEMQDGGLLPREKKKASLAQSQPLMLALPDGDVIAIGKNNRQNDWLTGKWARADDWWFHTQKMPGSHVILRTQSGSPPDALLELAASLAAYFSKGRRSSQVPVDYTKRRYVKKPSGAKPGFVIYQQQRTLYVTPQEDQIQQLIADYKK